MTGTTVNRPGRNNPCHCGSGKKYKRCCLGKDEAAGLEARAQAAAEAATAPSEEQAASKTSEQQRPTEQPWKRGANDYRPFKRFMAPRKRGDR